MKRIIVVALLVMGLSSFSIAQGLGFHGIAAHAGLILPQEDGLETGFGFGAKVDMGEVADGIGLYPIVAYHMPGTEFDQLTFSVLVIGADAQYNINEDVYVGGGIAYNNVTAEIEFTNPFTGQTTTTDDSEGKIGFSAIAGYKLPLGGLNSAVEARYGIVGDYNHLEIGLDVFFDM